MILSGRTTNEYLHITYQGMEQLFEKNVDFYFSFVSSWKIVSKRFVDRNFFAVNKRDFSITVEGNCVGKCYGGKLCWKMLLNRNIFPNGVFLSGCLFTLDIQGKK